MGKVDPLIFTLDSGTKQRINNYLLESFPNEQTQTFWPIPYQLPQEERLRGKP